MPHLCILSFLSWQSSWAASAHHLSWNVGFLLPTYSLIKVLLKLCFTNLCLNHFFSKEKKIWRGRVYKANNRYKNIHTIHILTVTSLLHLTLLSKAKSLKRAQTLYFWVDFFLLWLKLEYYYPRIINTWKSNQKTVKLQLCLLGRAGGSSLPFALSVFSFISQSCSLAGTGGLSGERLHPGWCVLTAKRRKMQNRDLGPGSGVGVLMPRAAVSRILWAGYLAQQCSCCCSHSLLGVASSISHQVQEETQSCSKALE